MGNGRSRDAAGIDRRTAHAYDTLLEGLFVTQQIPPWSSLPGTTMCHLRQDGGGREIDLILEAPDGRVVAIEVKAGSTPDLSDAKHLIWLRVVRSTRPPPRAPERGWHAIALHTWWIVPDEAE